MRHALSVCLAAALAAACGGKVVFDRDGDGGGGGSFPGGSGEGGTGLTAPPPTTNTSTSTSTGVGGGIPSDILDQLNAVPGMDLVEQDSGYEGYRWFVGTFEQPADHNDPDGLKFPQQIYILHKDTTRPTVLNSTGYALWGEDFPSEPTLIADANQISVEHRFFTPSRPEPADWQLLTIEQAAADHHRLVEALKPIYDQSWLSTGASKGGMTSMYHRRFYPDDVDGTVPYVAPLSYGVNDARYIDFLDNVGTASCRDALVAFQIEMLSRRASMIPFVEGTGADFGYWGSNAALDFAVESVRFALWQYADPSACDAVPPTTASDQDLFNFLEGISAVEGSDDFYLDFFEPYYFQAALQLGAPGTDESYLASLLSVPVGLGPSAFVQPGPTKQTVFRPESMPDIQSWTIGSGSELLFIYGEVDPWTAGAFEISGANDTWSFTAPGMNHGAGIYGLPEEEQAIAVDAILRWAGQETTPPNPSPASIERARLARLIDSSPSPKRRAELAERARELGP
ncbi:MAG: hypothetical protein JNK04_05375 [Myxococcales bacterium]|nr:hypothetical protein [Myxococcales bacterium]